MAAIDPQIFLSTLFQDSHKDEFKSQVKSLRTLYHQYMFSPEVSTETLRGFINAYESFIPFIVLGARDEFLKPLESIMACQNREKIELSFDKAVDLTKKALQSFPSQDLYQLKNEFDYSNDTINEYRITDISYYFQLLGCHKSNEKLIEKEVIYDFFPSLNAVRALLEKPFDDKNPEITESRIDFIKKEFFYDEKKLDQFFLKKPMEDLPYNLSVLWSQGYGYDRDKAIDSLRKNNAEISVAILCACTVLNSKSNRGNYNNTEYDDKKNIHLQQYLALMSDIYENTTRHEHKKNIADFTEFVLLYNPRFSNIMLDTPTLTALRKSFEAGLLDLNFSFQSKEIHPLTQLSDLTEYRKNRQDDKDKSQTWLQTFLSASDVEKMTSYVEKNKLNSKIIATNTCKKDKNPYKL